MIDKGHCSVTVRVSGWYHPIHTQNLHWGTLSTVFTLSVITHALIWWCSTYWVMWPCISSTRFYTCKDLLKFTILGGLLCVVLVVVNLHQEHKFIDVSDSLSSKDINVSPSCSHRRTRSSRVKHYHGGKAMLFTRLKTMSTKLETDLEFLRMYQELWNQLKEILVLMYTGLMACQTKFSVMVQPSASNRIY